MPRVSIGIPVFNGEKYLRDALDSALSQTFEDFEILISDNASTDSTPEIAAEYCARDSRVRYHRQETNLGAAANFNYVFHHTTGEFFHWSSYDDMLAPEYLEECVAALDADNGDAVLSYPQTLMIDADGNPLRVYDAVTRKGGSTPSKRLEEMIGPDERQQSHAHLCFPVFGLIRREALIGTSLIANMPRSDTLLLVELALRGAFIEVEKPLFLRREHDKGSVISAENEAKGNDVQLEKLLAAWFDPKRGNRFPATLTRLGFGYLKASLRTRMPIREWLACVSISLAWLRRHRRWLFRELKLVLKDRLRIS